MCAHSPDKCIGFVCLCINDENIFTFGLSDSDGSWLLLLLLLFYYVVNAKHANNLSHLWWPCRSALCFIWFNRIDDCCMLLAHLMLLVRFVLNVWRVRFILAKSTHTRPIQLFIYVRYLWPFHLSWCVRHICYFSHHWSAFDYGIPYRLCISMRVWFISANAKRKRFAHIKRFTFHNVLAFTNHFQSKYVSHNVL